jgi:hypothetical protein
MERRTTIRREGERIELAETSPPAKDGRTQGVDHSYVDSIGIHRSVLYNGRSTR